MTHLVTYDQQPLPGGEPCFHIRMQAPRANALEPGFLSALHHAFDALEHSGAQKALLSGGRNFSTGGDAGRFHQAAQQGDVDSYARSVVPVLQSLVMRIISAPVLIASALRGATTGGAAGLPFASDLVTAASDAFVQPYYGVMGFAPDGGWTALLPELIGVGPAQSWLMANHRQDAAQLATLGLVHAIDPDPETRALALLDAIDTGSALATKSMLWTQTRRATVQAGLNAEAAAFQKLIGRPETLTRMSAFLQETG